MLSLVQRAGPKSKTPWPLALILALYTVLAFAYNAADPLFEPPDEHLHYDIVRFLQRAHTLPVVRSDDPPGEYHQPPLYYALSAVLTGWIPTDDYAEHVQRNPFWGYDIGAVGRDNKNQFLHGPNQAFPYRGTALVVHLVRLLSTAAGLLAITWTYGLALNLLPGRRGLALACAALVAFTPNFLLTTSAVTNDAFVVMAPVGLMLAVLCLLDQADAPSLGHWAGLGLLLGLAALIKVSAVPMLVVSAVAAGWLGWRRRSWHAVVMAGAALLGPVLIVAGWWFARNMALYGDITGLEAMWRVWGTRPPLTWAQVPIEARNFRTTFWANFGYGNVPAPPGVYYGLDAAVALAGLGLVGRLVDYLRGRADPLRIPGAKLLLVGLWVLLTVAALLWYLSRTIQVTGRQVYAALPALSFLLIWGWARLLPQRRHGGLALAIGLGAFTLGLYGLFGLLLPAYRPSPRLSPQQAEQAVIHRLDWNLGEAVRLLGYTLSPEAVRPGETVQVTLYWRPVQAPGRNYTVFVHLLGEQWATVGARDTYPGLGHDPTLYWQPGETIVDTIPVKVAAQAEGPLVLDVEAGLYELETGERLPIVGPGGPIESPVIGQVKLLRTAAPQPPHYPLDVAFDGGVTLAGYDLSATEARPGDSLTLTLHWLPAGPLPGEAVVFVHLVDASGEVVAQGDGPPRGGRYPAWAWEAGQPFTDPHPLALPASLAPGQYHLRIGLYDPASGVRLTTTGGADLVQLEQAIRVR